MLVRGYSAVEPAKHFLRPRLERLHSPHGLPDAAVAVDRLVRAARDGETVLVHGDYDVDGICSTTIIDADAARLRRDARCRSSRAALEDGYDLSEAGVRAAIEAAGDGSS